MKLVNRTRNNELANDVHVARTFSTRLIGLLNRSHLPDGQALWIDPCNSIHTWFMRFAIDVVFVDRQLVVRKVCRNVRPWRITSPAWSAHSVFELPAGTLTRHQIEIGDQLHVGD